MRFKVPKLKLNLITVIIGVVAIGGIIYFVKRKGDTDTGNPMTSSGLTGGGKCPAGSSGLDKLAESGELSEDKIKSFCASHAGDCGCTSL